MVDLFFEIKGAKEVAADMRALSTRIDRNSKVAMQQSMGVIKGNIIPITPVGYPGSPDKLVESYASRIEGGGDELIGTFYSMAPHEKVATIEEGRAAGAAMPPIAAILPWVQWKFGGGYHDAVMTARSIQANGSEGHFMFAQAADQSRSKIVSAFEAAVERSL
jgi:hypothetical protein